MLDISASQQFWIEDFYRELAGMLLCRCRSFQAVDLPLPSYTAVARVGPGKCDVVDAHYGAFASASFRSNLIWALSRHLSSEKQSVSSWTGFNIRTRSDQNVTADHIVYLPPVDGLKKRSACDMSLITQLCMEMNIIRLDASITNISICALNVLYITCDLQMQL